MKQIGAKEILQVIQAYGRYTIDPGQKSSKRRLDLLEDMRRAGALRLRKATKDQWEYVLK